jgi:hypothetical protein
LARLLVHRSLPQGSRARDQCAEPFDADELALDAEQPLDGALGLLVASFADVVVADDAVRPAERGKCTWRTRFT